MNLDWRRAVLGVLALLVPGAEAPLDGVFEVVSEVVVRGRGLGQGCGDGGSTVLFQRAD